MGPHLHMNGLSPACPQRANRMTRGRGPGAERVKQTSIDQVPRAIKEWPFCSLRFLVVSPQPVRLE